MDDFIRLFIITLVFLTFSEATSQKVCLSCCNIDNTSIEAPRHDPEVSSVNFSLHLNIFDDKSENSIYEALLKIKNQAFNSISHKNLTSHFSANYLWSFNNKDKIFTEYDSMFSLRKLFIDKKSISLLI